jgi:hypothetical protein
MSDLFPFLILCICKHCMTAYRINKIMRDLQTNPKSANPIINFCMQDFLRAKYLSIMFHPDYKYITDRLPVSIKDRAYQRLLNHS